MKIAGICFLIFSGILVLLSIIYFIAYFIFEKLPHKAGKALGVLYNRKYKKDVAVWDGFGKYDGPPKILFTIRHLTKSKYLYRVNNKLFLCTYEFWRKPHKVPNNSWVIYLKAFPRISYLDHSENCVGTFIFVAKAITALLIALCTSNLGIAFLSKV